MSLTTLEQHLNLLEAQFGAVSAALIAGDPDELQLTSTRLQQLALDLFQMTEELGAHKLDGSGVAARIRALATSMPLVRENLLRRAAYVEHALELVVPRTPTATYAGTTGPYGNAVRQSGQFKVFAA